MHRCFVDFKIAPNTDIVVCGDEAKHMSKVLRLEAGDNVEVCDGSGFTFSGTLLSIAKNEVTIGLGEGRIDESEPSRKVYLFAGLSKGAKMELVIQKSVELGVTKVIPVETEFSVAKEGKTERWQRIAFEAAKQCKRPTVPEVSEVLSFKEAVSVMKSLDVSLCAYEKEDKKGITEALNSVGEVNTCGIFVGSEGGFSEKEIQLLSKECIPTVSLGKRILRTETAAIVLLTIVMHHFGELN